MILDIPGLPLELRDVPVPEPSPRQLLIKVSACGVCRTDLHILDGERFMAIAPNVPVRTTVREYQLADANRALNDVRNGAFSGAAVLKI